MKLLITGGADINGTDETNLTPLVMAIDRQYNELAYFILSAGADPNIQHIHGHTALIDAARNGNMAMVKTLVAAGADRFASLPDGQTALNVAQQSQQFEVAVYLAALDSDEP